ncbi:MAG: hypothetical protein R3C56_00545 [Pirellulaceae bacterium]
MDRAGPKLARRRGVRCVKRYQSAHEQTPVGKRTTAWNVFQNIERLSIGPLSQQFERLGYRSSLGLQLGGKLFTTGAREHSHIMQGLIGQRLGLQLPRGGRLQDRCSRSRHSSFARAPLPRPSLQLRLLVRL